ncbi:MAG: hypothetical protein ACSLE5_10570 [Porticoccaceae bacterium]
MEQVEVVTGASPETMESLRLPAEFDGAAYATALEIDALLTKHEATEAALEAKIAAHRHIALSHLLTFRGTKALDINRFRWPPFLYIPKGANAGDYWISPAPEDHRYGLEWTSPATAEANMASRQDGTLFSFGQLRNESLSSAQSSESGVGVFYKPPMTLGVIDLQPHVECSGTLRTFMEFFPQLAAGYVEVKAHLLLAAWQQIPGGFDLLGFKLFDVATSGRRDQSHGPELLGFQNSFAGPGLSAPFVVQGGRSYLLGVVGRISVTSTLRSTAAGGTLAPISNTKLRVWGSMNCVIPQIDVLTKRVDIS